MKNIKRKIYNQIKLFVALVALFIIIGLLLNLNSIFDFIAINTFITYLIINSNNFLFNKYCNFNKINTVSYLRLIGTFVVSLLIGAFIFCFVLFTWLLLMPYLQIDEFPSVLKSQYPNFIGYFLIITLIFIVYELFKGWKNVAVNVERKKFEELKYQYEILKSQVNPHFLFNSLNILNSIISKNPEHAKLFVQNFSKIYRYVLEKRDYDYVSLSEELNFIESYFYLIKSRHLEKIIKNINIVDSSKYLIIPMSLQLLVENAIKHNAATAENPLEIKIYLENDYIVIWNNINRKKLYEPTSKNRLG